MEDIMKIVKSHEESVKHSNKEKEQKGRFLSML